MGISMKDILVRDSKRMMKVKKKKLKPFKRTRLLNNPKTNHIVK